MARLTKLILAAALVATPALAQNPKAPVQELCVDNDGHPALCQFTDVPRNGDIIQVPRGLLSGFLKGQGVVSLNGSETSYPAGATPVAGVATGTTGAVTGTLAAAGGVTNYLCTFDVSAIGGTATVGPITVTGLTGGKTLTYQMASTASGNFLVRTFNPCIPASGPNTAISVATTADGTASAVDVNLIGFQQ